MDETQKSKADIRKEMVEAISKLPAKDLADKIRRIHERLFDLANFLEAKIALLYIQGGHEVKTEEIIKRAFELNKIVVLPYPNADSKKPKVYKIDDMDRDMQVDAGGIRRPDPDRCRAVPMECIDIAIIPGLAFDEKGGRIGPGDGYYDRLIPHLPITTRKVALALDFQVLLQVPTDSHDKHVDIIITDKRIIYKI
jgi:5-formyltetrahydrofolate cyclo-ligase